MYDPLVSSGVTPQTATPDSYWHATHQAKTYPTLDTDHHADVTIIGAGYAGLSAALYLAQHSELSIAVVDAHSVGFGCSGRNGGFVLSGSGRLAITDYAKKFGEDVALGMQSEFSSAVSELKNVIQEHAIDCDLTNGPYLKLAHRQRFADSLQSQYPAYDDSLNGPGYLTPAQLKDYVKVTGVYGATCDASAMALHPLKLVDGLAHAASAQGAKIFTRSPVSTIERLGDGYRLHTPQGSITCENVLITSNAYTPKQFHPAVDTRQFPVRSSIIVTAPLTPAQQAATGLNRPMTMMDTRMMKYYYRSLPDGRVLFGGRGAVTPTEHSEANAKERLTQALVTRFPQLSSLGIDYFWGGWVSVALDSYPRIHYSPDTRIGYSMGYCGSGVSFATYAGRRLAQRLLNQTMPALPLYQTTLPRYPLPHTRRLALRGLYAWAGMFER